MVQNFSSLDITLGSGSVLCPILPTATYPEPHVQLHAWLSSCVTTGAVLYAEEVGRRLALINRALIYHEAIDYVGPRVIGEKVTVTTVIDKKNGAAHTKVSISFLCRHSSSSTVPCTACSKPLCRCSAPSLNHHFLLESSGAHPCICEQH